MSAGGVSLSRIGTGAAGGRGLGRVLLALMVGALALMAAPPASRAAAPGCPHGARKCVTLPAKRVVATGTHTLRVHHGKKGRAKVRVPYVVLHAHGGLPRPGTYVEIPSGRHDRSGFAGVVVGEGHRAGLATLLALPPLPDIAAAQTAAATASRRDHSASATSTVLDLLSGPLVTRLAALIGQAQCTTGTDFPIKLTGVSLDPRRFELTGPVFKNGRVSAFGLSAAVSPTATLALNIKEKAQCEWKRELGSVELPPPPATFLAGGVPFILRGSGEVSTTGSVDGVATGSIDVGTELSGGIAYNGGALQFAPTPTVNGFARVTKPLAVQGNATLSLTAAAVARMLFFRLWGPRVTLSFGPELNLQASSDTSSPSPCSKAKISFPLKLGVGFGANPGAYFGLGKTARDLADKFGAKFNSATFQQLTTIVFQDQHGRTFDIKARVDPTMRTVWNLEKAFDTPDLIEFTGMPFPPEYLPVLTGSGGSLSSGEQCTTVTFGGSGSLTYAQTTHDPDTTSDCGGSSTTSYSLNASDLAWREVWRDVVFGGHPNGVESSALGGLENNSGTVAYDYSGCSPGDPNQGANPCNGAATCTQPWSGACSGQIVPGQEQPSIDYNFRGQSQTAKDHLVASVDVGLARPDPCLPAFNFGPLAGAPLIAVFDLYPSSSVQTTTLTYRRTDAQPCDAVQDPPPGPDTTACDVTPGLNATVTVEGPYTARPAPASEQPLYALKPA
jgi:hypothetical protein